MLSQNPDKKPQRAHRGNKSPRKLQNNPATQSTFISSVKTRSALKSPAAKNDKAQQLSDPEEELDDFVNEIDRALHKSKSKRKQKQQVKKDIKTASVEQSSKKDSDTSAAKKTSTENKKVQSSSKSPRTKKSKGSGAKSEFSFKKSSTKNENLVAEVSGNVTVSTSQKSQVREKQQKVRQWIDLKAQTLREDGENEKKCLSLLDLVEAVVEAQKLAELSSDADEAEFGQIQWIDIYEGSQSFFKLNLTPRIKHVQKLILDGLDLLAKDGRYDLKVTTKIRSEIAAFENLVKMTEKQIERK